MGVSLYIGTHVVMILRNVTIEISPDMLDVKMPAQGNSVQAPDTRHIIAVSHMVGQYFFFFRNLCKQSRHLVYKYHVFLLFALSLLFPSKKMAIGICLNRSFRCSSLVSKYQAIDEWIKGLLSFPDFCSG